MLHWQKGRAHVFNVENVNGKMHYVDAQTGKPVKIGSYLAASRPLKTQIVIWALTNDLFGDIEADGMKESLPLPIESDERRP